MFGDGVFEMLRTFNHSFFLLDEHIDRLLKSMKFLDIPITKTKDEIKSLCIEAFERNSHFFSETFSGFPEECRLMINVSRGPLPIYQDVFKLQKGDRWNEPTWIINVWELSKTSKTLSHFFDDGINLIIPNQRQIPSRLLENKVKNRSRMHYQMANLQVKNFGKDAMPLLLDEDGFVAESSGANFLMIEKNKIICPELRNLLRGSTMSYILDTLAPQLNIEVKYKNFEPYDIMSCDEAMLVGTFYNILPCNRLNGKYINDDIMVNPMGTITTKLYKQWNHNVQLDIVEQMKSWSK